MADRAVVGVGSAGVCAEAHQAQYERRGASDPLDDEEFLRILTGIQRGALGALVARASESMQKPRCCCRHAACKCCWMGVGWTTRWGCAHIWWRCGLSTRSCQRPRWKRLRRLVDRLQLDPPEIVLQAEAVLAAWHGALGSDGVGLDIGGRHTAVMVWREGALHGVANVPQGGRIITVSLGRACQADEERAEKLKLGYSHGQFDAGQREWIGGLLRPALTRWLDSIVQVLRDLARGEPLPPAIWVWGGGSELADSFAVARTLAQHAGLRFGGHPSVRLLNEEGSSRIENRSGSSMHLLGINVNAAPCGLVSPSSAPALIGQMRKATLTACEAEQISYWIPVDG